MQQVIPGRVRDYLKQSKAYEAYRLLTAAGRVLPDFLVIGAMRGGTTSLYRYLIQHPCVLPAFTKEVHYFSRYFGKGINWYKANFPRESRVAQIQMNSDAKVITGEASPGYAGHPEAPQRIAEALPQAKAIMLVRNPVDRAYSHYHHEVRKGREQLSFEEALNQESERLGNEVERIAQDGNYYSENLRYAYQLEGLYIDQLERWETYFPRKNLLVIKSEDFYEHTAETLNKVFEFLNVPKLNLPHYERFNYGSNPSMDPAVRSRLLKFFEPYNKRLYLHIGRDLDWEDGYSAIADATTLH